MATLTIKNLPDEIYAALKQTAKKHRRSINSEAIVRLEHGIKNVEPDPETIIERIRKNRVKLKGMKLTDEFLGYAKNEGRP